MEFKIDTKDAFTTIMPAKSAISAKLTDELALKMKEMRQSGSANFVIDLRECDTIDEGGIGGLAAIHEDSYGAGQSLVLTGICSAVMATLKQNGGADMLNIAPTMVEAVDIISMEILERDLLSEE